jgi:hypothetical protein
MVASTGAGPEPIPHKSLTARLLAEAISYCLTPEVAGAAQMIAEKIKKESGVGSAVKSFYSKLPPSMMSCEIIKDRPAVWSFSEKNKTILLSKKAAEILIDGRRLDAKNLKM